MSSERYTLIDGMRGLAALSVMLYHIGRDFLEIPILHYGGAGVYVFFVISGFVICHSLIRKSVGGRFFALFMLRRSVRLDPTYWVSIALALFVLWLPSALLGYTIKFPTSYEIGLHAFYLQDLVGVTSINVVFWTLCYEIQFYLIFCAILFLAQKLFKATSTLSLVTIQILLLSLSLAVSLLWPLGLSAVLFSGGVPHGLFINLWYLFLLGCFSYLAIENQQVRPLFYAVVTLLLLIAQDSSRFVVYIGLAAATLFYIAGRLKVLTTWLRHSWLQYLGLISYSLYLVHDIVGLYVRDTGLHLAQKYFQMNSYWFVVSWVLVSILISLFCSALMYRYVEQPSLKWSKRIRY